MAARDEFPELKRLDAEISAHGAAMSNSLSVSDDAALKAWFARRNELVAAMRAFMADIGDNLCPRCSGTGLTTHYRHNGMCYRCQGDGWSAKGRRSARKPVATTTQE